MLGTTAVAAQLDEHGADLREVQGLHLQRFDPKTGRRMWDFKAAGALADGDVYRGRNPQVIVYGSEYNMHVDAGGAVFRRKDNSFDLIDEVIVTMDDPSKTVFRTDSLSWDADRQILFTENLVSIQREGLIATGFGMELQPGEDKRVDIATLKQTVKMKIDGSTARDIVLSPVTGRDDPPAPDSPPMHVSSSGPLTIDLVAGKASLQDTVEINRDGVVITCDSVEVEFDSDTRAVVSILCEGNVTALDSINGASGSVLSWDVDTGLCEITGEPDGERAKTWRGDSTVSADVIWFYEPDRKILWSGRAHIQSPIEGIDSLRFGGDRQKPTDTDR